MVLVIIAINVVIIIAFNVVIIDVVIIPGPLAARRGRRGLRQLQVPVQRHQEKTPLPTLRRHLLHRLRRETGRTHHNHHRVKWTTRHDKKTRQNYYKKD